MLNIELKKNTNNIDYSLIYLMMIWFDDCSYFFGLHYRSFIHCI